MDDQTESNQDQDKQNQDVETTPQDLNPPTGDTPTTPSEPNNGSDEPEVKSNPLPVDTPTTPTSVDQPVNQPSRPSKKAKPIKRLVLLVVILIVIACVVGYLIHKHHEKNLAANSTIVQHLSVGIEGADLNNSLYPEASSTAGNTLVNSQVFDGLVQYENQNQIAPDLASGWTTPNSSTWIFTIKNGVKFHDGHTLTAADVVYSLNLIKNQNSDYAESYAYTLKSIKLDGANKVMITTTQPDPVLLNKLTFLYIVDPNLPKGENQSMAGTGAYEFKPGTKLTNSSVQLIAFDHYHEGTVQTKAVTIDNVASNNLMISGFKDHKYDIIGEVPTKDENIAHSSVFNEQDNSVNFIGFNTTTGALSNKLVREAIRYAVNPRSIEGGNNQSGVIPISQLIPPSIPGYNPTITAYQQNTTKAKQLLAQAGYSNGLTLTLTSGSSANVANAAIVAELKQIGITVKLNALSNINDIINDYIDGQSQLTLLAYSSSTLDGADVLNTTVSPSDYKNASFYNLVNEASTTISPSARLKLLQQAETLINQDIAAVPLDFENNTYLMDKPYVIHQDLPSIYISVYFNKVHL